MHTFNHLQIRFQKICNKKNLRKKKQMKKTFRRREKKKAPSSSSLLQDEDRLQILKRREAKKREADLIAEREQARAARQRQHGDNKISTKSPRASSPSFSLKKIVADDDVQSLREMIHVIPTLHSQVLDSEGNLAIHVAAQAHSWRVCQLLLDNGSVVDKANDMLELPLHMVLQGINCDCLCCHFVLASERGVDRERERESSQQIGGAGASGGGGGGDTLFVSGFGVRQRHHHHHHHRRGKSDQDEATSDAVAHAGEYERGKMIACVLRRLCGNGNDRLVRWKSRRGNTPLHYAARGNSPEIVRTFLSFCGEARTRELLALVNGLGLTPFMRGLSLGGSPRVVFCLHDRAAHSFPCSARAFGEMLAVASRAHNRPMVTRLLYEQSGPNAKVIYDEASAVVGFTCRGIAKLLLPRKARTASAVAVAAAVDLDTLLNVCVEFLRSPLPSGGGGTVPAVDSGELTSSSSPTSSSAAASGAAASTRMSANDGRMGDDLLAEAMLERYGEVKRRSAFARKQLLHVIERWVALRGGHSGVPRTLGAKFAVPLKIDGTDDMFAVPRQSSLLGLFQRVESGAPIGGSGSVDFFDVPVDVVAEHLTVWARALIDTVDAASIVRHTRALAVDIREERRAEVFSSPTSSESPAAAIASAPAKRHVSAKDRARSLASTRAASHGTLLPCIVKVSRFIDRVRRWVLALTLREEDPVRRTTALRKFIAVAAACARIGNFLVADAMNRALFNRHMLEFIDVLGSALNDDVTADMAALRALEMAVASFGEYSTLAKRFTSASSSSSSRSPNATAPSKRCYVPVLGVLVNTFRSLFLRSMSLDDESSLYLDTPRSTCLNYAHMQDMNNWLVEHHLAFSAARQTFAVSVDKNVSRFLTDTLVRHSRVTDAELAELAGANLRAMRSISQEARDIIVKAARAANVQSSSTAPTDGTDGVLMRAESAPVFNVMPVRRATAGGRRGDLSASGRRRLATATAADHRGRVAPRNVSKSDDADADAAEQRDGDDSGDDGNDGDDGDELKRAETVLDSLERELDYAFRAVFAWRRIEQRSSVSAGAKRAAAASPDTREAMRLFFGRVVDVWQQLCATHLTTALLDTSGDPVVHWPVIANLHLRASAKLLSADEMSWLAVQVRRFIAWAEAPLSATATASSSSPPSSGSDMLSSDSSPSPSAHSEQRNRMMRALGNSFEVVASRSLAFGGSLTASPPPSSAPVPVCESVVASSPVRRGDKSVSAARLLTVARHFQTFLSQERVDPQNATVGLYPSLALLDLLAIDGDDSSESLGEQAAATHVTFSRAQLFDLIESWNRLQSADEVQRQVSLFASLIARVRETWEVGALIVFRDNVEIKKKEEGNADDKDGDDKEEDDGENNDMDDGSADRVARKQKRASRSRHAGSTLGESLRYMIGRIESSSQHSVIVNVHPFELPSGRRRVRKRDAVPLSASVRATLASASVPAVQRLVMSSADAVMIQARRVRERAVDRLLGEQYGVDVALLNKCQRTVLASLGDFYACRLLLQKLTGLQGQLVRRNLNRHSPLASQFDAIDRSVMQMIDASHVRELRFFEPTKVEELERIEQMRVSEGASRRFEALLGYCEAYWNNLQVAHRKMMDGTIKLELSDWWLALIKTRSLEFLTSLGFDHDAVPPNYLEVPPRDFSTVVDNFDIVHEIMQPATDIYNFRKWLVDLLHVIYARIDPFLADLRIAVCIEIDDDSEHFDMRRFVDFMAQRKQRQKEGGDDVVVADGDDDDKDEQRWNQLDDEKLSSLYNLVDDFRYLDTMRKMDQEIIDNGVESGYDPKNARLRLTDVVPVSGLIMSRFTRTEQELRSVMELWAHSASGQHGLWASGAPDRLGQLLGSTGAIGFLQSGDDGSDSGPAGSDNVVVVKLGNAALAASSAASSSSATASSADGCVPVPSTSALHEKSDKMRSQMLARNAHRARSDSLERIVRSARGGGAAGFLAFVDVEDEAVELATSAARAVVEAQRQMSADETVGIARSGGATGFLAFVDEDDVGASSPARAMSSSPPQSSPRRRPSLSPPRFIGRRLAKSTHKRSSASLSTSPPRGRTAVSHDPIERSRRSTLKKSADHSSSSPGLF
jgi:RasGEF domain/Ankyrin repeat